MSSRCHQGKDIDAREAIMYRTLTILATVAALAVSAAPASAGTKSPPRSLGAANDVSQLSLRTKPQRFVDIGTTERLDMNVRGSGIIMRDGGVCDPIRHMGC
jgi:hypothetical protein